MNHEGHAVALITGDSTTDQRVAVLNRYSEREREREGGGGETIHCYRRINPCIIVL